MRPISKAAGALALILLLAPLAGCSDQRILDRVAFVHSVGYDLNPNGKVQITASYPGVEAGKPIYRVVLTAEGNSSKDTKIKMSRQTSLLLVNGQLRDVLFSSEFARKGVKKHIDTLLRDSTISPQTKIVIVEGSVQKLLKKSYKQHAATDKYINFMLEKESKGHAIPKTTLYQFERDMLDDGIDASVPIIKDIGDHIEIDGIGLFRADRYVMRIPPEEAMIFSFLQGALKEGEISMELPGQGEEPQSIMFDSIVSDRDVRVAIGADGGITATISIKMRGSIREYTGEKKLGTEADRDALEKEISEHLSKRAERLVKRMQANKADGIGIGMYVRNHMSYRAWKSLEWDEQFPKVRIESRIQFDMKDFGRLR